MNDIIYTMIQTTVKIADKTFLDELFIGVSIGLALGIIGITTKLLYKKIRKMKKIYELGLETEEEQRLLKEYIEKVSNPTNEKAPVKLTEIEKKKQKEYIDYLSNKKTDKGLLSAIEEFEEEVRRIKNDNK